MLTKSYPIPNSHESIALQFERGYYNIHIYYRKRLITIVENIEQIKNGFVYHDDELGKIELTLSESPITINVIFDGVHSSANASNPAKLLGDCTKIFATLGSLSIIGTVISYGNLQHSDLATIVIQLIYDLGLTAIYFIAAIYTSKGKAWGYFLGFYSFLCASGFMLLISVLSGAGFYTFIHLAIRLALILMLRSYYKDALGVLRAGNVTKKTNSELLDY